MCIGTVSYTHLDVYKRQTCGRTMASECRCNHKCEHQSFHDTRGANVRRIVPDVYKRQIIHYNMAKKKNSIKKEKIIEVLQQIPEKDLRSFLEKIICRPVVKAR